VKIAVFGATSGLGRDLVSRLHDDGHDTIAIGRDLRRLRTLIDVPTECRIADLRRPESLAASLVDAQMVVSVAHARFTAAVLAALPDTCLRVVLLGSTRRFTRLPDHAAEAVRLAETALATSGQCGVMLHPTMIYGRPGDRTVRRILAYLQRWPRWLPALVPLPAGGRVLVQPVFAEDVVHAIRMALIRPEAIGSSIVVAGPAPMTSADLIRACARAIDRKAVVISVPMALLKAGVAIALRLGFAPTLSLREVERLTEDKNFDVGELRHRLGIEPTPLAEGLQRRNYLPLGQRVQPKAPHAAIK